MTKRIDKAVNALLLVLAGFVAGLWIHHFL